MKGRILAFSIQSNSGAISGEDGKRYNFNGTDWKEDSPPDRGMSVDFLAEDDRAKEIYIAIESKTSSGKSKVVAGLLAIFLGSLGIHKFYLGYTVPGIIFLIASILGVGAVEEEESFAILPVAVLIISLIEGIIYLTRSNEDFERTYVVGKKQMF